MFKFPLIITTRKSTDLTIGGHVRGWVTENGIIVPNTYFEKKNTIQNALKYYLAYKIGADVTNLAMDNLFTASGTQAGVGAAQDGKDGITHGTGAINLVNYILQTTKNAGGTNAENYIEFYGLYDGAATLTGYLHAGNAYDNSNTALDWCFSSVAVNTTTAAGQKFHYYWKFTIS